MTSAFGQIITPNQVERAVINTLKKWTPTYLREMERHSGREPRAFPNIRSFRPADVMAERFPEEQIPACQVMIADEVEVITQSKSIDCLFTGDIDILVSAPLPEACRELALIYTWTLGMIMVQQLQLDGSIPIAATGWDRFGVPAVGRPAERWMAMGSVRVSILVEGMCDPLAGPDVPTEEEPAGYPLVESTHFTVELEREKAEIKKESEGDV